MLASLIGGFVIVLIGVTLAPIIADSVFTATHNTTGTAANNVTGAALTLVNLVTLFYCIGVMTAGISVAVNGLKQAGLM